MRPFQLAVVVIITSMSATMSATNFDEVENVNYAGYTGTDKRPGRRLGEQSSSSGSTITQPPLTNIEFHHGVASGDADDHSMILWTRITPTPPVGLRGEQVKVQWIISSSKFVLQYWPTWFCKRQSRCGSVSTDASIDFTVKVLVKNLSPNSVYYYRFYVAGQEATGSDIGTARTLPGKQRDVQSLKFAFASCMQFTHGFFNNLGDIAKKAAELKFLLWLGDYIYEFPNSGLVNGAPIGRTPQPNDFLYTLEDYRARYRQRHMDADVQKAHKKLTWYIMWDDHEVVNDHWKDGAPARWHDPARNVTFAQRKANGYQAFFEYTPVRPLNVQRRKGLYRAYRYGTLFNMMMMDARSQRTQPASSVTASYNLSFETHYLLGNKQRNWLLEEIDENSDDDVTWNIIGDSSGGFGDSPPNTIFPGGRDFFGEDKWQGYSSERQILLDKFGDVDNVLVLSGGPHTGMVQNIYEKYNENRSIVVDNLSRTVGVEFLVDATAAPKLFEDSRFVPNVDGENSNIQTMWGRVSPYMKFLHDGYCIMSLDRRVARVEYWINANTSDITTRSVLDKTFCVHDGVSEAVAC